MMLKIAYLGEEFHGFVRQPGLRTVEGDLREAFGTLGYSPTIRPASRTDRGVSALGNVLWVDLEKENICRMLTSTLNDIWVHGYSLEDWNPRHGVKHYTYFLCGIFDYEKLEECCRLFSGVHDFSAFTRERNKNTVKEIDVSFEVKEDMVLLHFMGKSFLWEMIRRCVTGMKEYLSGRKTEREILNMLEGQKTEKKEKVPAASPENLILLDITYKFPLLIDQFSVERMRKEFYTRYELFSVKKAMVEEILDHS